MGFTTRRSPKCVCMLITGSNRKFGPDIGTSSARLKSERKVIYIEGPQYKLHRRTVPSSLCGSDKPLTGAEPFIRRCSDGGTAPIESMLDFHCSEHKSVHRHRFRLGVPGDAGDDGMQNAVDYVEVWEERRPSGSYLAYMEYSRMGNVFLGL